MKTVCGKTLSTTIVDRDRLFNQPMTETAAWTRDLPPVWQWLPAIDRYHVSDRKRTRLENVEFVFLGHPAFFRIELAPSSISRSGKWARTLTATFLNDVHCWHLPFFL